MNVLNQLLLDNFILYLKKDKYKDIIQELKLDYSTDDKGDFIFLLLIKIKKSERNKGYGSAVLKEIVQLADTYNVRIKLWLTCIYGMNYNRLLNFYVNHGFVLDYDDYMFYIPKDNVLK